jgi:hypothetical protein
MYMEKARFSCNMLTGHWSGRVFSCQLMARAGSILIPSEDIDRVIVEICFVWFDMHCCFRIASSLENAGAKYIYMGKYVATDCRCSLVS